MSCVQITRPIPDPGTAAGSSDRSRLLSRSISGHSDPVAARGPRSRPREFNAAIDSKLRGCDLVRLRVSDIHLCDSIRLRTTIVQQKTGRPVPFELTEPTREALASWLRLRGLRGSDWLFPSRSRPSDHLTTRQYGRLLDGWVALIGLDPAAYGTHSLRRTKVALVYKRTGNLRACQLLLGHTKLESTVRYLGIEVDDALILSEQTDL